jgi:hypothetical protein
VIVAQQTASALCNTAPSACFAFVQTVSFISILMTTFVLLVEDSTALK